MEQTFDFSTRSRFRQYSRRVTKTVVSVFTGKKINRSKPRELSGRRDKICSSQLRDAKTLSCRHGGSNRVGWEMQKSCRKAVVLSCAAAGGPVIAPGRRATSNACMESDTNHGVFYLEPDLQTQSICNSCGTGAF